MMCRETGVINSTFENHRPKFLGIWMKRNRQCGEPVDIEIGGTVLLEQAAWYRKKEIDGRRGVVCVGSC